MAEQREAFPISTSVDSTDLPWSYTRRIGSNLLWLLVGDVGTKLVAFLSTVWLARKLTDEGFGKLAFVQAAVVYLSLLVDAGLSTYGAREIAKREDRAEHISSNIIAIRSILAFAVFVIFSVGTLLSSLPGELKTLFIGGALWVFPHAMNLEFSFQGLERMQYVSLGRFLIQFVYLVLVVLLVRDRSALSATPYYKAFAGVLAATTLICMFWRSGRRLHFKSVEPSQWLQHLRVSVVMALSFVVIKVYYTFDTLMLGVLDRPQAVGWYNAAYKIILLFIGIAGLIQFAFGPFFSREGNNQAAIEQQLRRFALLLTFFGGLFAGTTVLASRPLVVSLYGASYAMAVDALVLLAISVLFIYLDTIFLVPLLYGGFQKQYLYAVSFGAALNIALNSVAIPLFSYRGAAATTVVSNALIAFVGYVYFRRHFFLLTEALKTIGSILVLLIATYVCCLVFIETAYISALAFLVLFSGSTLILLRRHLVAMLWAK